MSLVSGLRLTAVRSCSQEAQARRGLQQPGVQGSRHGLSPNPHRTTRHGVFVGTSLASHMKSHTGDKPEANLKSISHSCHPIMVAFVWELTEETIHLPLACLQAARTIPKKHEHTKRQPSDLCSTRQSSVSWCRSGVARALSHTGANRITNLRKSNHELGDIISQTGTNHITDRGKSYHNRGTSNGRNGPG